MAEERTDENTIDEPLVWNEVESKNVLVGKILTEKEFSRATVKVITRKAWNLNSGVDVVPIAKNAFFKFSDETELNRIVRGRPWSIEGNLLNLVEWKKFMTVKDCDFSKCPIWIQLHDVPLEAMNLTNAICIGNRIGEVVMVEDPNYNRRMLRSYLRLRVVLDLRKPLVAGFWILKPNGDRVWSFVKYKKIQDFCYRCGCLAHNF